MEKVIWIIEDNREDVLDLQRKINSQGGMRAMCILSATVLKKIIEERVDGCFNMQGRPSLIVVSYDMITKDDTILEYLKSNQKLAGVPLFFIVNEHNSAVEEEAYTKGAMLLLEKPVNSSGILRIEHASWQYEMAKTYEHILHKQNSEIEAAKEIRKLNLQLESRNEFLHKVFGKYFSDEVLSVILEKNEDELIGGDKRELAILFSDLRGFTSISEKMTADKMTDLLNCYFGAMSKIIMQYSGTIIEYMGDGILAVFGAPIRDDKYCANAISAAICMQNEMDKVNEYCEQMGYDRLKMGIGVHCGEGFIGNVGSEDMMRYNVMGNVVNVCSRIESCCVGGQVMASKDIIEKAKVDVHIADDMYIYVKGVSDMLNVCPVTGIDGEYNCYLNLVEKNEFYGVENDIKVYAYPIINKLVQKDGIELLLKQISKDSIEACILKENDMNTVEPYTDIELKIQDGYDGIGYIKAYGKITNRYDNNIKIAMTRTMEDFDRLFRRISNGDCKKERLWMPDMEKSEIYLVETELNSINSEEFFKNLDKRYILAWALDNDDIKVAFYSNDSHIRALEFIDFLSGEYGAQKGNKRYAYTVIPKLFMNVMKNEKEVIELNDFFVKKVDEYFTECDCIYADEYIENEKDNIMKMQEYVKKTVPWAYVKTTDVVKSGEKFKLKSLEHESNIVFSASEDLYIMIGCRGEIYNISREKFMSTYDITDEPFDIYMQMPDYIPEIELYSDKTYISLDDKAYLCYPKRNKSILAKRIERRTKVYSSHNKGEYFVGRPGDFMALRTDDLSDIYIIKGDIFEQTYETVK